MRMMLAFCGGVLIAAGLGEESIWTGLFFVLSGVVGIIFAVVGEKG